jgi:hypothetical protein
MEKNIKDLKTQIEQVNLSLPLRNTKRITEGIAEEPAVIFTEIHAITADWITRNKTYYPSRELMGNPNEGTGAISFFYPYPVPILRDHNDSGGMFGGEASLPFGRVYNCNFVSDPKSGGGYLRTIAAITDREAIDRILTGRWLTVSIGSSVNSVVCSICGTNLTAEGFCEHDRGQIYEGKECYWILGSVKAKEISFVNVPSDINAKVVQPSLSDSEARVLLAGTDGEFLLDLNSGDKIPKESYRENSLGITKATYDTILESAEKNYYNSFSQKILSKECLQQLKQRVKGY